MNIKIMKRFTFIVLFFVVIGFSAKWAYAQGEDDLSGESISTIGFSSPVILVNDPNLKNIKIPTAVQSNDLGAASATFIIDYVSNGGTDLKGNTCLTFPDNAKTAFAAAADIWANKITSTVPITIRACWANLGDPSTLGYSGGGPLHLLSNGFVYGGALANSLVGYDIDTSAYDMQITYNTNFTWYYGTDANPPAGQFDLVTVAAHEIAHGLEFGGSAFVIGSYGYLGYGDTPPYYPSIYDTFIEDGVGTKLTSYTDGSLALGTALQSNNLWFDGPNANAANGNARVKIYAPPTWSDGSSYSHLDDSTFSETENNMMVYAIGSGSANHNPGTVTLGLFDDLGWDVVYPPANDKFTAPILVSLPAGQKDARYTGGATTDLSDPEINQCGITGKGNGSVWYKYTPGTNETVAFNTVGSDFDTFIVIWKGTTVNTLTFVTCDKGGEATAGFQATGGDVYYIEVGKP